MSQADNFAINDKAVQDFVLTGEVTAAEVTAGASASLASGPTKWMSLARVFGVITKLVATLAQIRAGTDDTTIVTPLKLKQRGDEFSAYTGFTGTAVTLTTANLGGVVSMSNTAPATVNMPLTTTVPAGAKITFVVTSPYAVTLAVSTGSTDKLTDQTGNAQAYVLGTGDTAVFTRVGAEWRLTGGSLALQFASSSKATTSQVTAGANDTAYVTPAKLAAYNVLGFQLVKGETGYIKFPTWLGSFILQWTKTATLSTTVATTWTFPIAFPAAVCGVVGTFIGSTQGTFECAVAPTQYSVGVANGLAGSVNGPAYVLAWGY